MRAAKVDRNQPEIVRALRQIGASVQHLHKVGEGCPDLIAGFRGVNYLIEVKDGAAPPSQTKLTPDQAVWHQTWEGRVYVAYSVTDALRIVGAIP